MTERPERDVEGLLDAERDKLEAAVERLRAALAFVDCGCGAGCVGDHDEPDVDCEGDRNIRIATRALEPETEG